jgi:hypothetical protein
MATTMSRAPSAFAAWGQTLTCYTGALGAYLAADDDRSWRLLADGAPYLGLAPAGMGLLRFEHHPRPPARLAGLRARGTDDPDAAGAGLQSALDQHGRVIVAADSCHLPWLTRYGKSHGRTGSSSLATTMALLSTTRLSWSTATAVSHPSACAWMRISRAGAVSRWPSPSRGTPCGKKRRSVPQHPPWARPTGGWSAASRRRTGRVRWPATRHSTWRTGSSAAPRIRPPTPRRPLAGAAAA